MNQALLPERRVALRIGINLDDIIMVAGDVFGDGVNIAARLEALAEPGSVYVSEIVRDRVAGKVDFDFVDLGPKNLKRHRRRKIGCWHPSVMARRWLLIAWVAAAAS
jgi:adenylate cyclase